MNKRFILIDLNSGLFYDGERFLSFTPSGAAKLDRYDVTGILSDNIKSGKIREIEVAD